MKGILFYIFLFFIITQIKSLNETEKDITPQNITDNTNSTLNSSSNEKPKKKRKKRRKPRVEQPKFEPETSGVHINDTVFDEKLKKIIEEKNLNPNKKITKEQLKSIFVLIYKKEEKPGDRRKFDEDSELTPKEQSEQFMDTLFNKVAKGLDWDDKIKVKDIKEWIPPEKTKEAYNEMLYSLAEEMGYL